MTQRTWNILGAAVALLFIGFIGLKNGCTRNTSGLAADVDAETLLRQAGSPLGSAKRRGLSPEEAQAFGVYFLEVAQGRPATPPGRLVDSPGLLYVAARDHGRLLGETWATGRTLDDGAQNAVKTLRQRLGARFAEVNEWEVDLPYRFRDYDPQRHRGRINNRRKGLVGIEMLSSERTARFAPTWAVAHNVHFQQTLEQFAAVHSVDVDALGEAPYVVRTFDADQIFIEAEGPRVHLMFRGNTIVRDEDITQASVTALADAMGGWMFNNLTDQGRLTYLYEPKDETEPDPVRKNNMIRQWMGTVCLVRWALHKKDPALLARAKQNIDYNLAQFYREDGAYGYIVFNDISKLGAIALSAISLLEHPDAGEHKAKFDALVRSTDKLLNQETGRFQTYFRPDRDGTSNLHNFYPGETHLLWALMLQRQPDAARQAQFRKSFEHYRQWHLEHRRPAFVPWHAQADYLMWELTKDDAYKDFVFRTNDWLIDQMQDPEYNRARGDGLFDHLGRFYSARKSDFGPPHSASTGVYLEGLIDAWRLAKAVGDADHQEKYRRAIVRGLRSTMQLAFLDNVDMYYVTDRDRLRGGVRARVDRNQVRVDNVQHNLMGIIKILTYFGPEDYRP